MMLSDLLRVRVWAGGEPVGWVIDARFLQGALKEGSLPAPELLGLLVGPRRHVSFLGYERSRVRAPAVIATFLRWRQTGCFLLDLSDVERRDDRGLHLRPGYRRYAAWEGDA